jgi:flagellin
MAINDVSLTSGMRANLSSLQSTVSLLNRTQQRLSTGKAVNSALDNAINYFAAQSLNNRASDLAGYKDSMANAVQTIQAASDGISGITSLLGSAKAIASSVAGLAANSAFTGVNVSVGTVTAGQTIILDGVTLTAGTAYVSTSTTSKEFAIGASASETAANIASAYNEAVSTGGSRAVGVSGSTISFTDSNASLAHESVTGTAEPAGTVTAATTSASSDRGNLKTQYNSIMDQISLIAADASFSGINLLTATTLTVKFGGSNSLAITGTSTTYDTGLGMAKVTTGWDLSTDVGTTQMDAVDTALATLRNKSKDLSNNLAIINARQDFSTSIINTLQTGADNLVLADTNQEGANMLMLQTRQSLGTTALSLSSQAAQSVLRLFQ